MYLLTATEFGPLVLRRSKNVVHFVHEVYIKAVFEETAGYYSKARQGLSERNEAQPHFIVQNPNTLSVGVLILHI